MAVAKNTLRILTLERLGETFNQQSCPLRYTPRKFIIHPEHKVCSLSVLVLAALYAPVCPSGMMHEVLPSTACWLEVAPPNFLA